MCGHSNSGKTQFALHLSAHASLNQLQTVAYLSTSSINAERVLEFMKILKSGTNEPKVKDFWGIHLRFFNLTFFLRFLL